MADTHHAQGPGKSVLGIGQRIVSIMVEMVETRLRLAVVELEEVDWPPESPDNQYHLFK